MDKSKADADDSTTFMFELKKKKFSWIVRGERCFSSVCRIDGLSWKIFIEKRKTDGSAAGDNDISSNDTLGVFMNCSCVSRLWSCFALVRFTLVSNKLGVPDLTYEFKHLFSEVSMGLGFPNFIDWNVALDPERGYIKDDTIKIRAYIEADPPVNAVSDYENEKPYQGKQSYQVTEDEFYDKVVRRISAEFKKLNTSIDDGRTYTKKLNDNLKATVALARDEIVALNKKLDEINSDEDLTIPIRDLICSLEGKIDKSCTDYMTAVEELKRLQLEEKESLGDGEESSNDEEENGNGEKYNNAEEAEKNKLDTLNGEPILLSMIKMLNEIKTVVQTDLFYNRQQKFAHGLPNLKCNGDFHDLCSHRSRYGFTNESSNPLMDKYFSSCAQRNRGSVSTSSCRSIPVHSHVRPEKNDGLSECCSIAASSRSNSMKVSKSTPFPSEEEASNLNLDVTAPLEKTFLFIGTGADGEFRTHIVSCLKNFYDLKKLYRSYEIIEE